MVALMKSPVVFEPEEHRYFLGDVELQGVTSTILVTAFPDKYEGVDPQQVNDAAKKGKALHEEIEFHDQFNTPVEECSDDRVAHYEELKAKHGLRTIANEYTVSDEEHYASQIDLVMMNEEDEICLVDLKTTYKLDKAYAGLQLSLYKRWFERLNPHLKVGHIYVMWLPNKDHSISEFHELSVVDDETIDELIAANLAGEPYVYNPVPDVWPELEKAYYHWNMMRDSADKMINSIKEQMKWAMQNANLSTVKTGSYTVSYIPAKTSKRFDSAAFKKAEPTLYATYVKETETAESIRVVPKKTE